MTTKAQRARHPQKISATQRQQLERMYDRGSGALVVSNRNTDRFICNSTAIGLVRLGLAAFGIGYMHDKVRITDAGREKVQSWRTLAAAVKQ